MSWFTRNILGVDPNPEPSFLDELDGVTVPAVDGTPAFDLKVRNGVAYVYDPAAGPLDGRSSLERLPVMPKARPVIIPTRIDKVEEWMS